MPNDAVIQVRLNAKTKSRVMKLFKRFGLSTSDGVRLLIHHALLEQEMPRLPNAESLRAIEEARSGKGEAISMGGLREMWDEGNL